MFISAFYMLLACQEPPRTSVVPNRSLMASPSTGGCNSACETNESYISEEDWLVSFDSWGKQPIGEATIELETLLFYAKESKNWLPVYEEELDREHRAYLRRELARDTIDIEMRVIDEYGRVRGHLQSPSFAFKEKQHLPFSDTGTLGYLETSGKVKRVGLSHLWSRW
ncbi:MAG: hypothetical protein VX278_02440 [Myxococcota bacterium]|nr:hypothetical protein [Myxococcota bacterium]